VAKTQHWFKSKQGYSVSLKLLKRQRLHEFFSLLASQSSNRYSCGQIFENFMCSENYICTLFDSKADSNLKEIFSVRCNTMSLQF